MAYQAVDPRINDSTVNVADRNSMATSAGYTGLDDFNNNKGSATYIGGGSSGSSGATPVAAGSYSDKYIQALQAIKSQPSAISDLSKTMTDNTNAIIQQTATLAQDSLNQIPIVSQIYSKLADSLDVNQTAEVTATTTAGEGEVGRQKAALASEGVSAGTGAVMAPVKLAENAVASAVATVLSKYQIQREQYVQEESKSIAELTKQADDYKLQGMTAVSDLSTKLAGLKLQEEQMQQQAAADIAKGESDAEKAAITQQYQSSLLDLKQQQVDNTAAIAAAKIQIAQGQLDLSAERLANTQSADTAAKQSSTVAGMLLAYKTPGSAQGKSLRQQFSPTDFKTYLEGTYNLATKTIEDFYTNNPI